MCPAATSELHRPKRLSTPSKNTAAIPRTVNGDMLSQPRQGSGLVHVPRPAKLTTMSLEDDKIATGQIQVGVACI